MDKLTRELHVKDYLRVLTVHRWVLIGVFVLALLAGVGYISLKTPEYRAEALILIEPSKVNLTEFKGVYDPTLQMGGALARREFYETQYQLIVGRDLLERTFEKFQFGKYKEFRKAKDPVTRFGKLFSVLPIRRSRLVTITFDWRNPEVAARVLDYQVNEYLSDYRSRNFGVTTSGLDALREKARELKPKLESKSNQVHRFVADTDMVSLEKTENIIIDRLKDINKSLAEVERKRIEYESVFDNLEQIMQENRPIEEMPEVAANQAIRDLKLEIIRTKQDLSELAKRFGPNHPEVKNTVARLKATKTKVEQEMESTLASAKAQLDRARKQEEDLRADLTAQEKKVMNLNKQAARYGLMTDSYETMKKTYNALVQRIEEIEVTQAAGSREDNIFVVNRPRVPVEPIRPKKAMLMALACAAGLLGGITLCFLLEYLDTTVKTKEDVERILDVPVIGYIPALKGRDLGREFRRGREPIDLAQVKLERSALAESFRSIRTALIFASVNGDSRCVQVTSSSPMEGKTLTSVNLAIAVARMGKKVLLVDGDLRKPRIHKIFKVSASPGLTEILADEDGNEPDGVIRSYERIPTLHYLPSGAVPPNPAELLGSERMKRLLENLKGRYDQIIIDTPPVTVVTDGVIISRMVQGTILVVRAFTTQSHMLEQTRDILSQADTRLVGTVINNVDMPRRGYYYSAYYYRKSGYYGDGGGRSEVLGQKETDRMS